VSTRDQFKQPLLTFSEIHSELVDIIVEQPHPLQHHAVVDEVISESGSTESEFVSSDYVLWSPSLFESSNTLPKESRSPADPCSDQRDSSISKFLSCQPSTTTWQDKLVFTNHSRQAKEVSIKDRPLDLSRRTAELSSI
jgi:hypothetical protein